MADPTFDGVNLVDARFESPGITYPANFGKSQLESGGFGLQGSTTYGFETTFRCHTTSHTDITNIIAKYGTVGDLVIGSTTYSNVMIQPPIREMTIFPGASEWFYWVSFVQGVVATAGTGTFDGGTP
ncbi:MAG: hypothetical protein M0Q91_07740 [Methanoregula sp.]|jgi:hypothetical protein|nr:hypothetical protein [Methanoregula sp.]